MKLQATLHCGNAALASRALQALPPDEAAAVDASALREFDSSALALLLQARRQAAAAGRAFELHGAPPGLVQLAQLYGVAGLLGLHGGG